MTLEKELENIRKELADAKQVRLQGFLPDV